MPSSPICAAWISCALAVAALAALSSASAPPSDLTLEEQEQLEAYRQQLLRERARKTAGTSASIKTTNGNIQVSVVTGKTVVFRGEGRDDVVDIFELGSSVKNAISTANVQSLIDDKSEIIEALLQTLSDKVDAGLLSANNNIGANRKKAETEKQANEQATASLKEDLQDSALGLGSRILALETSMDAVEGKIGNGVDGVEKKVTKVETDLGTLQKQVDCNSKLNSIFNTQTKKCDLRKAPGSSKENPAKNTQEIISFDSNAPSGRYWIQPNTGLDPEPVYVDMSQGYKGYMKVLSLCGTGTKSGKVNLGVSNAVNPLGDWTAKGKEVHSCGKVSNAFWQAAWSQKKFLLRVDGPSDGRFINNGKGTSLWTAETGSWAHWGTSQDPNFKHQIAMDCNNDGKMDRWETYTQDNRGRCGYHPTYWLYDHNYKGNPQCYGFGKASFGSNLHFMGLCNSNNKADGRTSGGVIWHKTTTVWIRE